MGEIVEKNDNITEKNENEVKDEEDETAKFLNTYISSIIDTDVEQQLKGLSNLSKFAKILNKTTLQNQLIPLLRLHLDEITDEGVIMLAQQLPQLAPLLDNNFDSTLDILVELAKNEEEFIRRETMTAFRQIVNMMDNVQCEKTYHGLIGKLTDSEWWSMRCSAGNLITIWYPKLLEETQKKATIFLKSWVQDESTIVRMSVIKNLIDLIGFCDNETIRDTFVPIFEELTQDIDDAVRESAIEFGIAIAKRLKQLDPILEIFAKVSEDKSWKIRLRLSTILFTLIPFAKGIQQLAILVETYSKFVYDYEHVVRVQAAKNLHNFTIRYLQAFRNEAEFNAETSEKFFVDVPKAWIEILLKDEFFEVRLALSENILLFGPSIDIDWFLLHILPSLIIALETETVQFRENILKNINLIPGDIDITKALPSTEEFIKKLMTESGKSWRTRRNLLLGIDHFAKTSTSETFNIEIKDYYIQLLGDPVFSVRRTAPAILPCLIHRFGWAWAKEHILPKVITFGKVNNYLLRLVPVFTVLELIDPSIDQQSKKLEKYLGDLRKLISENSESKILKRILTKIVILSVRLSKELEGESFLAIIQKPDDAFSFPNDDLKCYGEDTLENLQVNHTVKIFSFVEKNETEPCYLEGLLLFLIRDFLHVLKVFLYDNTHNVRMRAEFTLKQLYHFAEDIRTEVEHKWIANILNVFNEEELSDINKEIFDELEKRIEMDSAYLEYILTKPKHLTSCSNNEKSVGMLEVLDFEQMPEMSPAEIEKSLEFTSIIEIKTEKKHDEAPSTKPEETTIKPEEPTQEEK